ncbi:hypothetical protein [Streptomyces humi]
MQELSLHAVLTEPHGTTDRDPARRERHPGRPNERQVELVPQRQVAADRARQELTTEDPRHPVHEFLQLALTAFGCLDRGTQLIQVGLSFGTLDQRREQLSVVELSERRSDCRLVLQDGQQVADGSDGWLITAT